VLEAFFLIISIPLFCAGCLILASVVRDARSCIAYSDNIIPFPGPAIAPIPQPRPRAFHGKPRLHVLPTPGMERMP